MTVMMWMMGLACTAPAEDTAAEATTETIQTLDTAERLAALGVERFPAEDLAFDWMQTVWAYGVHRAGLASGDPELQGYGAAWMAASVGDFTGPDAHAFTSSDSMSPAVIASTVMIEDPAAGLEPIIDAAHAYLDVVPTTEAGAIVHWGEGNTWDFPTDQVWVDSQFMFGVFLVREHERTGERAHLERFVEQYALFSAHCRDAGDQLYRHAYDDASGQNIPTEAVYWARGNAWVLIAAAEALAAMEDGDPLRADLAAQFVAHAEAVLAHQAEDGLWRTVLNDPHDDPENYTETSASALIAYALARGIRAGVLDHEAVAPQLAAAVAGVEGRIDEKGGALVVEGTSAGTNPGDYDYYVGIVQIDDLILGMGAALMMLAEVDGLEIP